MTTNLIDFFKKNNWRYTDGDRKGIYFLSLGGVNGNYSCIADINEELERFIFISYLGLRCKPEKMKDMAELLTMVNSNLAYGNFEMSYPIGDIKFRTGIFYEETELSEKLISNVIFRNINSIDASNELLSRFIVSDISILDTYEELYNPKSLPAPAIESEN